MPREPRFEARTSFCAMGQSPAFGHPSTAASTATIKQGSAGDAVSQTSFHNNSIWCENNFEINLRCVLASITYVKVILSNDTCLFNWYKLVAYIFAISGKISARRFLFSGKS